MDRRRDGRYKQQQQQQQQQHESHHYDDRYNATYDNYDYEEDYGNQYANTVAHHHLPHPNALPHPPHPEDHGYEDEEDHWASQQQQDFYDTVPATNIPPVKPINQRNVARVQISTAQMPESENRNIPQAPPPPRFGPTGGYSNHNHNHNHHNNNNNSGNDRKSSKYGNVTIDHQKPRRDDVHIRFEAGAKREFPPKQTSFIDGFRSQDALPIGVPKKKEGGGSTGQPTNTIRSIINNLKGGGGGEKQQEDNATPRNRVSTNPFIRANQQHQNASHYESKNTAPPSSKNVAEVVEKMNNGDWPIQIEDDEPCQDKRAYQGQDKARQWETLHRKKDEKRSILEDPIVSAPPAPPVPTQHPPPPHAHSQKQIVQKQQSREENDEKEDEQQTSVSTDSALCSDRSDVRGPSPYKLPFEGSPPKSGELVEEAEKLLFYFKTHKEVLNYLGIGLTDRLWKHVQNLPNFDASIRVFKKHAEEQCESKIPVAPPIAPAAPPPSIIPAAPKITISQSFGSQDREVKSPLGHSHARSVSQNEQLAFSPQNYSAEEISFAKNQGGNQGNHKDRNNAGGRFVKKSAAALIAKKQGQQIEDPNSATEIIDPRIAEEIKNLKDREEELQRSRSELALVTNPPLASSHQMNPKKTSPGNNSRMRSAQSFDHLNGSLGVRSPIERSHSSHNVYHMKNGGNSSPYHHGNGNCNGIIANANYGSMPRPQNRKDANYHPQMREHQMNDGGYRQSRNADFFRQTPTASEATNAGWQKSSTPPFDAKSSGSSPVHSGLQLPAAGFSISSYQQRSGDKYQNPKHMYGAKHQQHQQQHDAHRKIGL